MNTNYRILVVDDEEDLCDILKFNLENEGYEVETANSAEEALKMDLTKFHLLLLDVMMGEISGFKMAKMLKQVRETRDIPIIFLTARDTENDAVTGFTLGADDYISKPFSLREVQMRIKAVLRRTAPQQAVPAAYIGFKELKLDLNKKEAVLTNKEFDLLVFLASNPNIVFSKNTLFDRIWGFDAIGETSTVTVHINRIREKIEDDSSNPQYIETVWGAGYRFKL